MIEDRNKESIPPMERASVLIAKEQGKDFCVGMQELATGRTAVIAQSGAGKSWTIGVVCEQLCKSRMGFCIIDTEGEYFSLKEKFELLWVGKDPKCDVDLEKVDLKKLALIVVKRNFPMIFDISDIMDERAAVAAICEAFYEVELELRTPYLLITEEADKFAPQQGKVLKEIEEISRRGRKRGIGLLLATQRPAFLNKNVLSQCNNQLIGKLTTEADLSAVRLFFASRTELEELPKLKPGEFFALGNFVERKARIHVIGRETRHKGFTPELLPKPVGKLSEIIDEITVRAAKPAAAPAAVAPPATLPTEVRVRAFSPKITREEVIRIAEAKKKGGIFGPKEMLLSVDLQFRPLVLVEVKYIGGIVRKSIKASSFILDGPTGALAEIEKGFILRSGFEKLLGLDEAAATTLVEIHKARRATIAELESKTGLPEGMVRASIEDLGKRKLITYTRVGHVKAYLPLIELTLPSLNHRARCELPAETGISDAVLECELNEHDLRNALKAIEPTCDITNFQVFYYPIYVIHYIKRNAKRIIAIDGLTGRVMGS